MSVRVGVLSFAHVHAPQYARLLASMDGADFVGVWDEDRGRGRRVAGEFGVRFFEHPRALFGEVEAVVVCSENACHARDVVPALEAGVDVLCEKPISTSVEDARAMIRASEDPSGALRIAFPVRYLPAVRQAREVVRGGAIGRVLAVSATNHGTMPGGWFLDPDLSGGGAVMDHTVHVVDALRWVFDVEVANVYAEVGSFFGAGGIDDAGILSLELEGSPRGSLAEGAIATVDPSWSRGAGYPTWGDVTMRITGTGGVVDVDGFARCLTVHDHAAGTTSWHPLGEDMNGLMLEDFLRGVAAGSPSGASGLDGLRALEVVLAAYESGRHHEPVAVVRNGV